MAFDSIERESMEYDVLIVGAGPAGLAAAIRLKQLNADLSVAVLEKGSEVGAHILSGVVVDPKALDELLPDWRDDADRPLTTQVHKDELKLLGEAGSLPIPNFIMPPLMNNHGNFIGSLGNVCRYLGAKAEELGVEIYPGFAAADVVYDEAGAVKGVQVGDMGITREGEMGPDFTPGINIFAKYTLIGEGVRGSLAKKIIAKYGLDEGKEPQKYGIGLKEVWQVSPDKHKPGLVQHAFGWPLDWNTGGGSFLYHWGDNLVSVGYVVHLNYKNPWLSPFDEFQRFKQHPDVRPTFEGGKRLSYGARAITEGGLQSVPKLPFPGGALIGCSAGFVNVPRIKGSHNAMKTGMLAAETVAAAIAEGRSGDEVSAYQTAYETSWVHQDLKLVRNVKPFLSKFGTLLGLPLGGIDMWFNTLFGGWSPFGTLKHGKTDAESLLPADQCPKIAYPKPDGVVSFDKLSSVFLSNTNHEENQPIHLKVADGDLQQTSELGVYGGPSNRYCPAGVYEWVEDGAGKRFQINAQNCVHCKTCDIKDPNQNITWTTPQGGEGPIYQNM
ncbi:electron transfer flavoprotein-ubiquinone oxidoreductase [Candidatus Phycosocius bacilliformis]|uniref:Electron transfer flavoprotein-ubiquinone oxidoreductase n=1 Tax=Candidatus Phycosocius bacilliformis TaxID=1445552 RepID=A0A2P2E8U4_9PROT|nr:electron transfer flavoprotein-ubiquinone oxidoreductase [Candidatus Phycosocius bacilliformis]GBF57490.1 electron transfer flavoprotein-ubiquinone oxidoreductase [Candidatus Phycosocius bacilliformis]